MCGTATGWAKMAFVCLFLGTTLHIAGYATTSWMTYETEDSLLVANVGLWNQRSCLDGACEESVVDSDYETDEFNAVRGLETIVLCLAIFATILGLVYLCAVGARLPTVAGVLMVLCYFSGMLSLTAMIIWMVTLPDPFIVSFSLGLTVLGYMLMFFAGTLYIPDAFEPQDPYYRSWSRPDMRTPYTPPDQRRNTITPISVTSRSWRF